MESIAEQLDREFLEELTWVLKKMEQEQQQTLAAVLELLRDKLYEDNLTVFDYDRLVEIVNKETYLAPARAYLLEHMPQDHLRLSYSPPVDWSKLQETEPPVPYDAEAHYIPPLQIDYPDMLTTMIRLGGVNRYPEHDDAWFYVQFEIRVLESQRRELPIDDLENDCWDDYRGSYGDFSNKDYVFTGVIDYTSPCGRMFKALCPLCSLVYKGEEQRELWLEFEGWAFDAAAPITVGLGMPPTP